jgi:hypothetical protein
MERDTERERVRQAWEEVGRDLAPALDAASAVVVIGDDPVAAAEVALGAGRVQGARRRVAIGDLVGEVEPLQALVTGDDPHGLVDSFLYGVSLNRIARPAVGFRNLYILPSGTEPVVAEEIFRNERWRRLAIGFSEVGALLLLVARADAPGVDALIGQLDGALVVDGATRVPDGVRVLAVAEAPAGAARALQAGQTDRRRRPAPGGRGRGDRWRARGHRARRAGGHRSCRRRDPRTWRLHLRQRDRERWWRRFQDRGRGRRQRCD